VLKLGSLLKNENKRITLINNQLIAVFTLISFFSGFAMEETDFERSEKNIFFRLINAVQNNNSGQLDEIIRKAKSITINTIRSDTFALMEAADTNNPTMIRIIIKEYNGKINLQRSDGWTALMLAARWNKLEAVRELLELGANPNLRNKDGLNAFEMSRDNSLAFKQWMDRKFTQSTYEGWKEQFNCATSIMGILSFHMMANQSKI
jgi:ankyrin repeat protein